LGQITLRLVYGMNKNLVNYTCELDDKSVEETLSKCTEKSRNKRSALFFVYIKRGDTHECILQSLPTRPCCQPDKNSSSYSLVSVFYSRLSNDVFTVLYLLANIFSDFKIILLI
jgi:hypothetical protein